MKKLLVAGLIAASVGLLPTAAHARPWHHHPGWARGPVVVVEAVPVLPVVPLVAPLVVGPHWCWVGVWVVC